MSQDVSNLQVIAVIHGGGYSTGTSSDATQNAEPLAGIGDVIVVSFNYRLGMFGFADMDGLAPGNLGLHDQRLALKWIQDHIADFGGDPRRVTIIGFSAGSRSVAAQIISTADKSDLFQSAILDAGVVPSPGFLETPETSFSRVKRVAEAVGCPTDSDAILECLRKAPVRKLISESRKQSGSKGFKTFVPTADGVFLPKNTEDYMEKNSTDIRKVRTIIGYSHDEGSIFVLIGDPLLSFKTKKTKNEILDYIEKISRDNKFPLDTEDERTRQKLSEIYIGDNTTAFRAATAFLTDARYKCPINSFIEKYSRHNENVYAYHFTRLLSRTYYKIIDPKILGAFHTSAFAHFSGGLFLDGKPVPDADKHFSLETMDMIAKFTKSEGPLEFRGVEWPSYSKTGEILVFNDTPAVRKGLASESTCQSLFPRNS